MAKFSFRHFISFLLLLKAITQSADILFQLAKMAFIADTEVILSGGSLLESGWRHEVVLSISTNYDMCIHSL